MVLFIILILIILLSTAFFYVKDKLNYTYKEINKENLLIDEQTEEELKDYRNIVILGIDSDQDDYEGTRRSDCIMIVSINNKTKDVKIVSVYRDTYLYITNYGLDKVTHAYAYGEEERAISTLNENLDLNIYEYVTINFEAVKKVIDAIDGVEITLTSSEATQITGISSGGTYTLNGEQALQYGRIRKIDNDYVRTERMRTVLTKSFEKAKSMDKTKLIGLIDVLLPAVQTNISKAELINIVMSIKSYNVELNIGWPYEVKGITLDRWYGVPVTLEENVVKLHKELFDEDNYEAKEKVKEYSTQIINKTGYR